MSFHSKLRISKSQRHSNSLLSLDLIPNLISAMKRERENDDEQTTLDLVSCLMQLSRAAPQIDDSSPTKKHKSTSESDRVFACKTCNREFSSFQALGGHRTSHNKPKLMAVDGELAAQSSTPAKAKSTHGCPICGVEFAIGQALGGHMRRHRDVMSSAAERIRAAAVPVLKKSNSSKRVSCLNLDLDLNLAPPSAGIPTALRSHQIAVDYLKFTI